MKTPLRWVAVVAMTALFIVGLSRLKFDADVLNLLPEALDSVRGLKLHQSHFDGAEETLITIAAPDEERAESAARSLAEQLSKSSPRVAAAEWRSPFLEEPEALSDLLAWRWLNGSPEEFGELTNRLAPAQVGAWLAETRETLATTFSPDEIARLGRDPFGLTRSAEDGGGLNFGLMEDSEHRSADGTFRVIAVRAADSLGDYRECAIWIEFLRGEISAWQRSFPLAREVDVGITGGPAFVAETAQGMEGDMIMIVPFTAGSIALLFVAVHRRLKPLVWLLILLAAVLAVTVALGGLIFGSLNAVSLGFAAILLGVSVDYGLVLYQELKADPAGKAEGARRAVGRGIVWSSITTAAAFASLAFGSLPGLAQLGALVAIGVLVGAFVMLRFFLPPLASSWKETGRRDDSISLSDRRPLGMPLALKVGVIGFLSLVAGVLIVRGLPGLAVSTDPLRPVSSEALTVSERMMGKMADQGAPFLLLISGSSEAAVAQRLDELNDALNGLRENARVKGFLTPQGIWPSEANRRANAGAAALISGWLPEIRKQAGAAGFSEEALLLTERVVQSWRRAAEGAPFPESAATRRLLDKAVAGDGSQWHALGIVYLPRDVSPAERRSIADAVRSSNGGSDVILAGWDLLGAEVVEVAKQDSVRIVAPMALIVLVLLSLALRSIREVAFCVFALGLTGLTLLAVMSLLGWSWTLLSLPAIPLLLGLSVDYSIHMQLATIRHGGDWLRVWRTTGVALALCAVTTSIGFGALALSHNQGLGDLGKACATGVLSAWLAAVIVVPMLRAAIAGRFQVADDLHPDNEDQIDGPSRAYGSLAWKAGSSVVRILPEPLLNAIGRWAGSMYRLLQPQREKIVQTNLLPLVGDDRTRAVETTRRLFREFGEKLVALWRFEAGRRILVRPERETDWARFTEAKSGGNGVLMVTPHLGNWELGGPALTERGEKLLILSNPEPGRGFTDIRRAGRARWGVETLIVGNDMFAFVEVIKRLQEGDTVALLIDRPTAGRHIEVELFGRPFHASVAAAEFARATGCAILPVAIVRDEGGHVLKMAEPISYDRRELRSPDARRELTQQIMRDFEPMLRQYPEQWFQFIPIWPKPDES
jgi:predicted exporter/lauroyl/myristoyl acyltransferase